MAPDAETTVARAVLAVAMMKSERYAPHEECFLSLVELGKAMKFMSIESPALTSALRGAKGKLGRQLQCLLPASFVVQTSGDGAGVLIKAESWIAYGNANPVKSDVSEKPPLACILYIYIYIVLHQEQY